MCAQSRRTRRGRPRLPIPKTLPDDLYDYSGDPALSTALQRRIPSPDAFDVEKLPVIDDWPHCVPVTDAEVDIFERYFGDVLDRLFGHKAAECETEGLHSLTPNVNKKP